MKTMYGEIPEDELKTEIIPDAPSLNLPNYLHKLLVKNIDSKTSYIMCIRNNKTLVLNENNISNKLLLNRFFNENSVFRAWSSKFIKLPVKLTPKLAYFIGYFVADGGLKDVFRSYKTSGRFEYKMIVGDEFLIQCKLIADLFEELFKVKFPIRMERIEKGEKFYYVNPTNKVIYRFITQVFDMPSGPKTSCIRVPEVIDKSSEDLQKWFLRGVFDADGDTRAIESGKLLAPRIKLRSRSKYFVIEIKSLLENTFKSKINGPYFNEKDKCYYIQIENKKDIIHLHKEKIFIHPIKKWRLEKYIEIKWLN